MANEEKAASKLELIRASQIDPKTVEWLWYPFIPYYINFIIALYLQQC